MLPILEDHLTLTQPPAMFELYVRANDLFEKYDLEDFQNGYTDLLVSADGAVDGVSTASDQAIYGLTMQYLKQITREHAIALNEEASMLQYIEVLEFIREIEHTELVQECLDALSCDDMDNLDKFARCMLLVCSVEEEDSMLFLQEIPDSVIRAMKDYFAHRVELEVQTEVLDQTTKEVYREMDKYARVIKGQEMRSYKYLFEIEGAIGLPFEYHFQQNQEYLLALALEAMVYECIGFAIVSAGGLSNPSKTILDSVSKTITDLEQLTRLQYQISKTLIDYRNSVSSGIGLVV